MVNDDDPRNQKISSPAVQQRVQRLVVDRPYSTVLLAITILAISSMEIWEAREIQLKTKCLS